MTQYLSRICLNYLFPYLLVQRKIDSFACVFIKTLKISPINADSLSVCASKIQKTLNLASYVFSLYYFSSFFLFVSKILVEIWAKHVVITIQKTEFCFNLRVFCNFDWVSGKQKKLWISDRRGLFDFDGTKKLKKRATIVYICNRLVFLVVFLFSENFAWHVIELFDYHLRPFEPVGLYILIRIFL